MKPFRWAVFGVLLALAGWGGYLSGSLLPCCPAGVAKAQLCCCLPVSSGPSSPCCPSQGTTESPTSQEASQPLPPAGVCRCWPTEKYLTTLSSIRFLASVWASWNPSGIRLLLDRCSSGLNWLYVQTPPPLKPRLQSLYCIWRK
ncbi:MAG TPA: hypothetical protein PLQ00_02340 [Thermoguttaceae bacterium]|nr:hypothetical protein [Thermoguttaceae bacterium]